MLHNHAGRSNRTRYIELDTRLCQACWKCIAVCEPKALGKIDFPFHKHVRIARSNLCRGCKKCVHACQAGAIRFIYAASA